MTIPRVRRGRVGYPSLLAEIAAAPASLAVLGNPLSEAPYVAVVGTRRPTSYGLAAAKAIAGGLARSGAVVVSGMAYGIDAQAHRAALDAGGTTIAVLGCGADVCYPKTHRSLYARIIQEGSIVAEYEDGTTPLPYRFPERNRIIAGMSLGVVIVEGRLNGGAMITARLAGDMGRDVFAVPGPVNAACSEGPHALMRDGARLVRHADDILEDLGFLTLSGQQDHSPAPLLPDERRILDQLGGHPEVFDAVAERANMPVSTAAAVLARLEIAGLVTRYPGSRFARTP